MENNKDLSRLRIEKGGARPGRRRSGRYVYLAAAVAAVILAAWVLRAFFGTVEVRASTVSLTYPSQELTVLNASGYIVAQRKASVASKTTGRLVWLGVEEGSRVMQGQVIARLESEDVSAGAEEAKANLEGASDKLDEAQAELDDATLNFERSRELYSREVIAKSAFDTAQARYRKALAAYEASEARVNASRAALKGAEVSLGYTSIRAPFDGVVLTKNADIGDIITPLGAAATAKAAVVTIADMGSIQVEVDVSESNIGKVKTNMPCEIQLDALPEDRFIGVVHMIVPTADRTKASVLVKVRFIEKDQRILPEMSAKVAFLQRGLNENERTPRTGVNPAAVITEDGKAYVYVIKDGIAKKTVVELGEDIADYKEVVSGLKTGEQVVVNPPKNLKDGSRVTLLEQ